MAVYPSDRNDTQPRYPSNMQVPTYREHGNVQFNGNSKRNKHIPLTLFKAGLVVSLVLGVVVGILIMLAVTKLNDKKAELTKPKDKYDVSAALMEQEKESNNQIILQDSKPTETPKEEKIEPEEEPVVEEVEEEEIEEEEEEDKEEEKVEEKDKNFEYFQQEILSSLNVTTAFAFVLEQQQGYTNEATKTKNYNGIFVKSDDITAINGYVCTALNNTSNYGDLGLVAEDTTMEDLSYVLFKKGNIKDIKPIAAGYEVYVNIPEKNLVGEYTLIYENYQLVGIHGKLDYVDPNAVSDNKVKKEENEVEILDEETEKERDILSEETDEILDLDEQEDEEEVEHKFFKHYLININNMQHM